MSASARRSLVLAGCYTFSQLVLLLLLRMPAVPGEGNWLQSFRGYFPYDQLSYASIATTAMSGVGGQPEPFTETGTSYYPSAWYRLLGTIAAVTGWSIPMTWTLAGWALLAVAVAVVGWASYRITGRAWAPALAGPMLLVGTLSIVLHDNWYTTLDSHAVLWGPYGALYVLNAEVAGLSLVAIALSILLRVTVGPPVRTRTLGIALTVAATLIGVTANVQTYSFLVGTSVAFGWLGAYGLVRSRSRALLLVSVVIVAATFVIGPLVGGLPVYALLIAATLPGVAWLARGAWRWMIAPAVAFVVTALPQATWVLSGILSEDAFLSYRQVQSGSLGVPLWQGLLATLPIGSVWLVAMLVQRRHRQPYLLAVLVGLSFAGVMLTFNNAWGFGQEPYRLWIDSVAVSAFLLAPVLAWSLSAAAPWLRTTGVLVPALVAAATLFALSLLDFGGFRQYIRDSGVIRFDTARFTALADLTSPVDGLLTTDPCLDPQQVKIVTGKQVAWFNLGLAWPERKEEIERVTVAWREGRFDPDAMRAAGVDYIVSDTACANQWPLNGTMGVAPIDSRDYADEVGAGTLTLWRMV